MLSSFQKAMCVVLFRQNQNQLPFECCLAENYLFVVVVVFLFLQRPHIAKAIIILTAYTKYIISPCFHFLTNIFNMILFSAIAIATHPIKSAWQDEKKNKKYIHFNGIPFGLVLALGLCICFGCLALS